ncbi:MAG TPA: SDR family oxidoreductase [Candidatus Baltobacteraceae bacterium]|nr:SDR family oxidoreductase [Candidatus Baltobacteraceae bacterium]
MAAKAIVTGASGGLGWEFAQLLAQAGYDLVLIARSETKLEANASTIRAKFGINADVIALDLSLPGASQTIFERVPECDVLVNNAGFANNGKFAQLSEETISSEVNLNVVALTELTRLYLPGMLASGSGRIMNVASTAGFLPGPNMAVYYATKAYVISFSEALAEEVRGTGVSVTVLCPGATETGFADRAKVHTTRLFLAPKADAASVARAGIAGMMRGKRIVIPGVMNKLVAFSPKISPRGFLVWLSGKLVERRS